MENYQVKRSKILFAQLLDKKPNPLDAFAVQDRIPYLKAKYSIAAQRDIVIAEKMKDTESSSCFQ